MSLRSVLRVAGVAGGLGLTVAALAADPVPVPVVPSVPVVPAIPAVPPVVVAPVPAVPLVPTVPEIAPPVPVPAVPVVPPVAEPPALIPPAKPIDLPPEPTVRAVEVAPMPRLVEPKVVAVELPKLPPLEVPPPDATPTPAVPVAEKPPVPEKPAVVKPVETPSVAKIVRTSGSHHADAFPTMLAEAKTAYAKVRDYTCHYVRLERLSTKLVPEQTCELRVRTNPLSVSVRVMSPKDYFGRETVYVTNRNNGMVKLKDAAKWRYDVLPADDAKVLADTRHTVTDTGLLAVLERVEKAVAVEKALGNPVQILVGEYTYAGRDCTRYEVFAERAHAKRYAHRHVVYIDKETKLPVRYEAYDQPKSGGPTGGEPIEVQSFVGLKFNNGLGENTFDR